jgi:ketosteroid isomerase-like protein
MIKSKSTLFILTTLVVTITFICLPISGLASTPSENIAKVVQYIESIMNKQDYSLIEDLIHSEEFSMRVLHHPVVHNGLPHTVSQHTDYLKMTHKNVPDLSLTIKDIAAEGDIVFTHITSEGTSKAGNVFSWDSIMLWRFKEGKIVDLIISRNHEHVKAQEEGKVKTEKQTTGTPAVNVEIPAVHHNTAAHVAKVIEFQIAYESHNIEEFTEHFHDAFQHIPYPNTGTLADTDEIAEAHGEYENIENYDHIIRDIAASGDVVFVHWVENGTKKSTGEPYHVEGMVLFKFKDGDIYRMITYTN